MTLVTAFDAAWHLLRSVLTAAHLGDRERRNLVALGIVEDHLPFVDDKMLRRYHKYLSEKLSFPFTAHYPEPTNSREGVLYQCTVLGLLDPSKSMGSEIDGIFCRVQKAGFELNLPLVELEVPHDTPNSPWIEDYWHWFWNWRCR
jgi:hypothetical protein